MYKTRSGASVRRIDPLGRITLPMDLRRKLDMDENDEIEITGDINRGRIILKKVGMECLKCGSIKGLRKINDGFYICGTCLNELNGKG